MVAKNPHNSHREIPHDLAQRLSLVILRTATLDAETGCLLRDRGVNGFTGYASVAYRDDGRRASLYAHRVMWTLLRGPIPSGLTIDHLCGTRNCVNVEHMEVVPLGVNVLRSNNPAAINARKKTCDKGHEFTVRTDGRRWCKKCTAARGTTKRGPRTVKKLAATDPRHGTVSAYTNYACRCDPCRQAMSAYYYAKKASA